MHNMHCISNSFFLFKSHIKSLSVEIKSLNRYICACTNQKIGVRIKDIGDKIHWNRFNFVRRLQSNNFFNSHSISSYWFEEEKNIQTPVYSLFSLFILTAHQFIFSTKISSLNSQTQHIIEMENYKIRIELEFLNLR